ncbi:isochorismatase family protein [Lacrimispora indolis]|uniref:isochorismatase family protein n=1 Tax=Lacrimispora indolis TaxID=69825 RepID=UPI000423E00D|nr:isochorismatase family protein [[Clostridium] methoxybenzovorans]
MVLLVVDVQHLIVTPDLYHYDLFVNSVRQLLHSARKNNTEIIYIRHDDGVELTKGADGFDIFDDFAPLPGILPSIPFIFDITKSGKTI